MLQQSAQTVSVQMISLLALTRLALLVRKTALMEAASQQRVSARTKWDALQQEKCSDAQMENASIRLQRHVKLILSVRQKKASNAQMDFASARLENALLLSPLQTSTHAKASSLTSLSMKSSPLFLVLMADAF